MSYCRFSDGDVYAYECEGGVQFWVTKDGFDRLCNTFDEAYRYAKGLRDWHGLKVPGYAIEELRIDALEEAKRISGPGSAVADLQAENATLRTQLADVTESMGRVEERCAKLRECFPAEMGKNRGRICPTCGCIVFDDEECCPDCNAEVDG